MGNFSHLTNDGTATMVDVAAKVPSLRIAKVRGSVRVSAECVASLNDAACLEIKRTARLAGIQAAKQTAQLIPLCHQIPLAAVDLTIDLEDALFIIEAVTRAEGKTGVEMEALCAATVAGITIYDMIKAVDPGAVVGPFSLVEKQGGKHGRWTHDHHA